MNSTAKDKDELTPYDRGHFSPKQAMADDQTSLGRIKVNISQSVPSDSVNKGPQVIVRSAALNSDIGITRKFGEGSTPLFDREDVIANNVVENGDYGKYAKADTKSGLRGSKSHSASLKSSHSASTEQNKRREYVHLGCCGKLPLRSKCDKSAAGHKSNPHKKNKVPYYRNEIREYDRLRRLYGESGVYSPRSPSPSCTSTGRRRERRRSTGDQRERKHTLVKRARSSSNNRQKSRKSHHDYSPYRRRRRSQSNNGYNSRRSSSRTHSPYGDRSRHRDRSRSPKSTRSRNKESSRHNRSSHSPCCTHQRHYDVGHRTRRSKSPRSQSRSTDRDRGNQGATQAKESNVHMPSTYIPVPVPVADYSYSFPHWSVPQNPWVPHMAHRPPTYPYGYPLVPLIPPIRPMRPIRYGRPTPFMPYGPIPIVPYPPRPPYRLPHLNPNVPGYQYRYKPQEKHK